MTSKDITRAPSSEVWNAIRAALAQRQVDEERLINELKKGLDEADDRMRQRLQIAASLQVEPDDGSSAYAFEVRTPAGWTRSTSIPQMFASRAEAAAALHRVARSINVSISDLRVVEVPK